MFNDLSGMQIFLIVWFIISLVGLCLDLRSNKKTDEKKRKCQHERFKLIHSETSYTNDLYEVKVNHYRCLGCGFIKKDEGFVGKD